MILKSAHRHNKRNSRRNGNTQTGAIVTIQKTISQTAQTRNGRAKVYVLLHIVQGWSGDVVRILLQNRHVLSVERVKGPPDIVAIFEAHSRTKLAAAVVKALGTVEVMIDGIDLLPV